MSPVDRDTWQLQQKFSPPDSAVRVCTGPVKLELTPPVLGHVISPVISCGPLPGADITHISYSNLYTSSSNTATRLSQPVLGPVISYGPSTDIHKSRQSPQQPNRN